MTTASAPVLALGFAGQALFTARVVVQWVASERARRSVSVRAYWHLSLAASACVLAYSVLTENVVFAASVVSGTVIAFRNLFIRRPAAPRALLPAVLVLGALIVWAVLAKTPVGPVPWAVVGFLGALIWSGRFLVQWWVSERQGASVFPMAFWILSLVGSLLLLAYAIFRRDPVMILAYAVGCVPYLRNMTLMRSAARTVRSPSAS